MAQAIREALRELTDAERAHLQATVRATSERADVRQRAVALLAVAQGQAHVAAARRAGYTNGTTVSRLVQRVNARGPAALDTISGRGPPPPYAPAQRQPVLGTLH